MVPAYSMLGKSVLQRCTSIPVVVRFLSGTLLIFNSGSCIFNDVYVVVMSAFPLFCYFSMFFCSLCFSLSSHFYANFFFLAWRYIKNILVSVIIFFMRLEVF